MEAPADPGSHASASASSSAAAPLRAPEVARLREEQEKVTGRAPGPALPAVVSGGARSPAHPRRPAPPVWGWGPPRGPLPPLAPAAPSFPLWAAALWSRVQLDPDPVPGRRTASRLGERKCWEKLLSRAFVVFCLEPFDLQGEGRDGKEGGDYPFKLRIKVSF